MGNLCLLIFEAMPQALSLLSKVITQIKIFSLDLGTSNKKFETSRYSLERSFQKE